MNKKQQLIKQIKVVIHNLEKGPEDINSGILELIHKRYKKALKILEDDNDIKEIYIDGSVRAYMDSYNDYENPLLGEMHKAEKLYKELL